MSRSRQPLKLVVLTAALAFVLVGALASALTATAAPGSGPTPIPKLPFTYKVKIFTQYGLLCSTVGGKHKCKYPVLSGTSVTVTQHGKLLQRTTTNAKGFATVKLPKGVSYLGFSHADWHGYVFGKKSFTITAPVLLPPGQYLTFTFCVVNALEC